MQSGREALSIKMRSALFVVTLAGMVGLASTVARSRGAAGMAPRVTEIKQITRDGLPKSGLLAADAELYVNEADGGKHVIAKIGVSDELSLGRSEARSLVANPLASTTQNSTSLRALDLSADYSHILAVQGGAAGSELWTIAADGSASQRLGAMNGQDANWSPDGKKMLYTGGSSLYLANADGSAARQIYQAAGSAFWPHFSPDGQRIRFTVTNEQGTALWEIEADGSNARALLKDWQFKGNVCCGSWTADGRYYIFQATVTMPNTSSMVTTLWALPDSGVGTDAELPVPLTSGPMSFGNAVVSHDNKRIWAIGVRPEVEVVKYLPEKKKFVPVIAGLSATDLSFSRDGKWVTYVTVPEGTLWRARANGTDRRQLTSGEERAALPNWSPDGKQIAYVSMKPGGMWKLYLVSANGGAPQEVVTESGSQIDANWSSDGTKLMFGAFNHDAGGLNIRILDFKTGKIEKVPGSDGLFSPRWSPDGATSPPCLPTAPR
jgi:Tol biopolymer transport system component